MLNINESSDNNRATSVAIDKSYSALEYREEQRD